MSTLAGARQYGTYVTLSEIKAYSQWASTGTSPQDPVLQRIIDMACTSLQNRIDRPIGAQKFWERHDGWSGEYIMLKETPFLELVSCTEWQSSGGPISLVESTPENPVDGIQINYGTGRIMRTFAGYSWPRPFFPGSRNIEITYMAGLNPVPPDLWLATAELVKYWWANTQQASAVRVGLRGQDTYDAPDTKGVFGQMPPHVEEMIEPYVKVSIA